MSLWCTFGSYRWVKEIRFGKENSYIFNGDSEAAEGKYDRGSSGSELRLHDSTNCQNVLMFCSKTNTNRPSLSEYFKILVFTSFTRKQFRI